MSNVMPVFALKARDDLALTAMRSYLAACLNRGLVEQAAEVQKAILEVARWREAHPALCKLPDHAHVPAGCPGSGSESAALQRKAD